MIWTRGKSKILIHHSAESIIGNAVATREKTTKKIVK
jgi:hypothetical protein